MEIYSWHKFSEFLFYLFHHTILFQYMALAVRKNIGLEVFKGLT